MSDELTPVIVGVGQLVQHDVDLREALEPLAMLERVSRLAAAATKPSASSSNAASSPAGTPSRPSRL